MTARAFAAFVVPWLAAHTAHAQSPPITDRDYSIDLYDGVAIGDTTFVGMGGAGAANLRGTAGVLLNPSAIAVRSTTDHSWWSLDWHLDALTAKYSSDYDNNGADASGGASLFTFGIGGRAHDWAFAFTTVAQATDVAGSDLDADATRFRFVVAKWIPELDVAVGAGVQRARFEIGREGKDPLFAISGFGVIAGATWVPRDQSFRLAAALESPIDGGEVQASCDPENCDGYILPDRVRAPWRLVAGSAYRVAATPWNKQVDGPYRDERALTLAADVVVTGATHDGYGLEAFGMQMLQPSGRHTVIGARGGADFEWLPGRLRLRAGAYWEPSRFDGVSGRGHVTFGGDLRIFQFRFFGQRRFRFSVTNDYASRYRNVGFSIGFWH